MLCSCSVHSNLIVIASISTSLLTNSTLGYSSVYSRFSSHNRDMIQTNDQARTASKIKLLQLSAGGFSIHSQGNILQPCSWTEPWDQLLHIRIPCPLQLSETSWKHQVWHTLLQACAVWLASCIVPTSPRPHLQKNGRRVSCPSLHRYRSMDWREQMMFVPYQWDSCIKSEIADELWAIILVYLYSHQQANAARMATQNVEKNSNANGRVEGKQEHSWMLLMGFRKMD